VKRVAIIGAGPVGLTCAKNALASGFDVTVFEKSDRIGGNWVFRSKTGHSSVYENTHLISSKTWSGFEDFPMPENYPDYPRHDLVLAYFESYVEHFNLMRNIRFKTEVLHAEQNADGGWHINWRNEKAKGSADFDALFVANGHHNKPRWPKFSGTFSGRMLHSHDFKSVDETWRGKDVLVVGAGNSAADVAVEAARLAKSVHLSMRSPQWFIPKFILGVPADVFAARSKGLPTPIRNFAFRILLRLLQGRYSDYGLPDNPAAPLSQHPTLNSDLIDFVRHGRIMPRAGIARMDGDHVQFADGTRTAFDIICCCTGFEMATPFLDRSIADFSNAEQLPLYLRFIPATAANLYFIGFIQPSGCIWPLADFQARLACAELAGRWQRPADLPAAVQREVKGRGGSYLGGARHAGEVDYHAYRAQMRSELKKAGIDIGPALAAQKTNGKTTPVVTAMAQ
jgi:cation diffusion facilitator CzcD-associated flavoprotein CzcO